MFVVVVVVVAFCCISMLLLLLSRRVISVWPPAVVVDPDFAVGLRDKGERLISSPQGTQSQRSRRQGKAERDVFLLSLATRVGRVPLPRAEGPAVRS